MLLSLAACSNDSGTKDPSTAKPGTTNTDNSNSATPSTTGWKAGQAGRYTYNYWGDTPSTWSPTDWETTAESSVLNYLITLLYNYRLNADKTGYDRIPYAAASDPIDVTAQYAGNEKYGVPADATAGWAYEIKLNDKITWEDGTPLTADDYIYTVS